MEVGAVTSTTSSPGRGSTPNQSSVNLPYATDESLPKDLQNPESLEDLEDAAIAHINADPDSKGPKVYGAQQKNLIVDARPTINAFAMQAIGKGSENMENYRNSTKAYLDIPNIHVMRDSLDKVMDALKDSDVTPLPPNREALRKSGWLDHIYKLLDGARIIARQVGLFHSHVLIHCSDGWDRTSQLSALSQLCLDPYYRTMEGFIVLVEKDWLSFGHMFRNRSGFLSSEKWFEIEGERIGAHRSTPNGTPAPAGGSGGAFENALMSAKGLFKKKNDSRESLVESDGEMQNYDSSPAAKRSSLSRSTTPDPSGKVITKVKETSPVFHQYLDCTYQLLRQNPTRFEFNERFLRRLLYHLYSCQYGTFLYDSEKQRRDADVKNRTSSVWDYFLSRKEQFTNPEYDPIIDDNVKGKERLLFPDVHNLRWWAELFGRSHDEMNGPARPLQNADDTGSPPKTEEPVLKGLENSEQGLVTDSEATLVASRTNGSLASQSADRLAAGLASLGIGRGASPDERSRSRPHSPGAEPGKEMVEVEMQ